MQLFAERCFAAQLTKLWCVTPQSAHPFFLEGFSDGKKYRNNLNSNVSISILFASH